MYLARVHVSLKESVLDPQGQAVTDALRSMGHNEVADVRIGKLIEVRLNAESENAARDQVTKYCDALLANPVIETYRIEIRQAEATLG